MFKKFVLVAIAFMGLTFNTETMATAPQMGWKIDKLDQHNNVIGLKNVGDQGGVMELSCNIDTGHIKLTYSFEGKSYDFYLLRRFGDNFTPNDEKLLIGSLSVNQPQIYTWIGRAHGGFEVERYPVGTKARWEANIKANNINAEYTPVGHEFFITGNLVYQGIIDMTKSCALNTEDKAARY